MNVASRTAPTLETVTTAVAAVCSRYPVTRVQVFGSLASGKSHAGSDVDLLVEFVPHAPIGLFEMGAIKEKLEQMLDCNVDLVSRAALERSKNVYRREAILRSPITVYAR